MITRDLSLTTELHDKQMAYTSDQVKNSDELCQDNGEIQAKCDILSKLCFGLFMNKIGQH